MPTNTDNAADAADGQAALRRELLRSMLLQRRFEERCAEAYALGKIGGFCQLENSILVSADDWTVRVLDIFPDGVHAVLDLVGGSYLAGNMKVLVSRGRIMQVGLTGGRDAQIQLGALMHKRIQLIGTVLRSRPVEEKIVLAEEFADRVLPSFDDGSLLPVVHSVIPFSEIRAAHDLMESNNTFGKIVLNWS
jgi:NADPH:quinone reductase-like Zn-dependent oxidoreductase